MEPIPANCKDFNSVGTFCACINNAECVDEAAQALCTRAIDDYGKNVTDNDLAELKQALSETDFKGC